MEKSRVITTADIRRMRTPGPLPDVEKAADSESAMVSVPRSLLEQSAREMREAESRRQELEKDLEKSGSELAETRRKLADLTDDAEQLEKKNQGLRKRIKELEDQVEKLEKKLE